MPRLFDASTLADPYPVYRRLQETDPVHWAADDGTWFLTRYDDVLAALHDPRLSARRVMGGLDNAPIADPLNALLAATMLFTDPPDHTRLRALFNKAFTPRAVEVMRADIQALVDDLLDAVEPAGEMDVIRDFAYPLPALVIARMFGVPDRDRERFDRWVHHLAAFIGNPRISADERRRTLESMREAVTYLGELYAQRRAEPGRDLLSALASIDDRAVEGSACVSRNELFANVVLVITAGHETTQNLIGNGTLALLRHPDELARLQSEPSLLESAIEELLRYDSPAQWTGRIALEPIELRGKQIRARQFVIACQGAANRDPRQFFEPERLDLTRPDNRHISFGYGPHFCIGAGLSRLEGQIAIGSLVRRFPQLRLARDKPIWRPNFVLRGLDRLVVHF